MSAERVERIKDYFRSGRVVCPYAKAFVDDSIDFVDLPGGWGREDYEHPIIGFIEDDSKRALVYLLDSDTQDHRQGFAQARKLFMGLYRAIFKKYSDQPWTWIDISGSVYKDLEPESLRNPFLPDANSDYLFSIAMGPEYPEEHPRYSPHAIVVITRRKDVAEVPREVVDSIRERAKSGTGGLEYDADIFYLFPERVNEAESSAIQALTDLRRNEKPIDLSKP